MRAGLSFKTQVCLVHQGRRRQRVPGPLAAHLVLRHRPQLGVDGVGEAGIDCSVGHGGSYPRLRAAAETWRSETCSGLHPRTWQSGIPVVRSENLPHRGPSMAVYTFKSDETKSSADAFILSSTSIHQSFTRAIATVDPDGAGVASGLPRRDREAPSQQSQKSTNTSSAPATFCSARGWRKTARPK